MIRDRLAIASCLVAREHYSASGTCKNPLNAKIQSFRFSRRRRYKRCKVRLKGRAREEAPNLVHFLPLDWYTTFPTSGDTDTRHDTSNWPRIYIYASFFFKYIILFVVFCFECNLLSPLISCEMPLIVLHVSISSTGIISGDSKSLQNNSLCTDKMSLHFRWDRLHVRSFSFQVFFHIFLI